VTKSPSPDAPRAIILPEDQVRASSFIARHQWIIIRKQWTCLASDHHQTWTSEDFTTFVEKHRWIFARTMPENPHEYTLRRNTTHATFDNAVRYMRDKGIIEYFHGKPYKMLHQDGFKYWTMGAPLAVTILINRKPLPAEAEPAEPPSGALPLFPFLPASVEALPRADCEVDTDDLEFFVKLVRESGTRIRGHWYLELDNYLYWTRGAPEKAQAIHRARRPV
jgi:hypothetical protein